MGYKVVDLKLPTDYNETELRSKIKKELRIGNFDFEIIQKSLDARRKDSICWLVRVGIYSREIKGGVPEQPPKLVIPFLKRRKKALVLGSGPAGFYGAYVLQQAGYDTTIIERGSDVGRRETGIRHFEESGIFNPVANYAYGEGGAGTFSDGKLTSRSKHITVEKQFIIEHYIKAGAPEEIAYLAHPHIGSDNLKIVVKNLREAFKELGGTIYFETMLLDLKIQKGKVKSAMTTQGEMEADLFLLAPGHSSGETYRMLIDRGVSFRTKNFALGFRAEHHQEIINRAQWGRSLLPGVKAAEYRLTSSPEGRLPVYSFCMCPGGMVVPATPCPSTNIVNGMSLYQRNGYFANAGFVAGIHPDQLTGQVTSASEALDWLQQLEESFFNYSNSYKAPFCTIRDFLNRKTVDKPVESSYPLGLAAAPLWRMLPEPVISALTEGLIDFNRKLKGYDTGILLGLESKTSSPVQVIRDSSGKCDGFENLYMAGEGSGYAGGIISSAADGIRTAMAML